METQIQSLLSDLKAGLTLLYGEQLSSVFLFGSYARGDQDQESDVDILVVLKQFERYGAEIDRTSRLTSELSLKYSVSISTVFFREKDWLKGEIPLLTHVQADGVAV